MFVRILPDINQADDIVRDYNDSDASTDSDNECTFLCLGCKDPFPLQVGWAISCSSCGCGYYCIPCMNAINNNQRRCRGCNN